MTLARVGSAMGPDLDRLSAIKVSCARKAWYTLREEYAMRIDLAALARAGIAGALVASCLHNGKLTGAQIARLPGYNR